DPAHAVGDLQVAYVQCRRPLLAHRSNTAASASAIRLIPITSDAIARAGNSVGHQSPADRYVYSSDTCRPQSGDGGWIPSPRKDRVATVKIAYPRRTVNSTMTGCRTFGRISTNMMYGARSPRSFAAETYSRSRSESTAARTVRAISGVNTKPMT